MNKEQIRQYFMVFILSLAVAGVFSLYLFYRRGYYDLFVLNKVLASASLALLGIVLYIASFEKIIKRINKKLWIEIQSWGIRIGTFLVLLHLIILKYAGWLKWLKEGGAPELAQPNFPPASLLGALFIAFVGIVRFGELFGK